METQITRPVEPRLRRFGQRRRSAAYSQPWSNRATRGMTSQVAIAVTGYEIRTTRSGMGQDTSAQP
jgi:hypothetical protein